MTSGANRSRAAPGSPSVGAVNPYPVVAPRRRRWPWVVPVVLLVLAVSVLEGVAAVRLVRGPEPSVDSLRAEAVLDAPISGTELGRDQIASRWGFGDTPEQPAIARAAYQVDLTPDAALSAWVAAYGDRYGLRVLGTTEYGLTAMGSDAGMLVTVTGGAGVALPPQLSADALGYAAPAAGSTVVTVEVVGLRSVDEMLDLVEQS